VDKLLEVSQALAPNLANRRLALEAEAILMIARRLSAKLRAGDPLGKRIRLSKGQYLSCCVSGVLSALARR
jgi:phytoene synthase